MGSFAMSVVALDTSNGTAIPVQIGTTTYGVAVDPKGARAYVTDFSMTGKLYVIDATKNQLIATVLVGKMPYGVAATGSRVYVANVLSNTVSVVDPARVGTGTNPVVDTLPAGRFPWGVAVSPDGGQVYVSNVFGSLVTAIDPVTKTTRQVPYDGGTPSGIVVSPDGAHLYVTNYGGKTLWVIDVAKIGTAAAIINRITVGLQPYDVVVNRDGTSVYVTNSVSNTVSVIDTSRGPGLEFVTTTVPVGSKPMGVAMTSDGSHVYVANNVGNSLSVIDVASNTVGAIVPLPDQTYPIGFGSFLTRINQLTVAVHVVPAVNVKAQGTLPVIIYGAIDPKGTVIFNVQDINFSALRLTIGTNSWPVKMAGNGPVVNYGDFNGDGVEDVMVHFDMGADQAVPASGSDCPAMLTGTTIQNGTGINEVPIAGCDRDVKIVH